MRPLLLAALFASLCFPLPSQAAPEYSLTLNLPIPPVHTRWSGPLSAWVKEIEQKSGGRIKIEPYFAEALSPRSEAFESVKSGIADITECAYEANTGQFPFHEGIFSIPSPGVDMQAPTPMLYELYKQFPQLRDEVKGVKFLFTHVSPPLIIGTKDKAVRTLADLKGMKINANSSMISERLKLLGVSVVSMPMSDVYTALEQGVIDGTTLNYELLVSRRFGDQIKNMTELSVQNTLFYCVMNQDVYDRLPKDLQKVIDDASGAFADKAFADYWATTEESAVRAWKEKMNPKGIYELSAADYTAAAKAMQPPVDAWFAKLTKLGLPGAELEKKFYELEAKHGMPWSQSPFPAMLK